MVLALSGIVNMNWGSILG